MNKKRGILIGLIGVVALSAGMIIYGITSVDNIRGLYAYEAQYQDV